MTLIELLVTIAIMGAGFLALLAAFSTVERQAGSTADNAQLVTIARQVADLIGTQPGQASPGQGVAYKECEAATGADYQTAVRALISSAPDTITITGAAQALSTSSHVLSSGSGPLTPIGSCGGGTFDYGVQQITFKITSAIGNSVTRTVYKRWN